MGYKTINVLKVNAHWGKIPVHVWSSAWRRWWQLVRGSRRWNQCRSMCGGSDAGWQINEQNAL